MPAARQPITLDRGSDFTEVFVWTDDDGAAQAIGEQKAFFTINDGMTGSPLCELTSDTDAIVIEADSTTGQVVVTGEAVDTANLKHTGMYLLQLVAATGKVTDIFYGPVRLRWRGLGWQG